MAHITTVKKSYRFVSPHLKTPNFKEIIPVSNRKDGTPQAPILMDEYGQTPDHFYLARKPPPSFYQVKRKLDLQSSKAPKSAPKTKETRGRRKKKVDKPEKAIVSVEKPRYDTSLGQLTKKFLKLLSDAMDGVLNLNTACAVLAVPKRRLYDITNVLEGAGLVQKTSRNNIQWMGKSSACSNGNGVHKPCDLEREIDILEAKENKLDELIYYMKSEINSAKEITEEYNYVTSEDLKRIEEFTQKMLIGVKTSSSVQVVENEMSVVVGSPDSEIEAYLLYKDFSFTNVLHTKAEFRENAYHVKMEKQNIAIKPEAKVKSRNMLKSIPSPNSEIALFNDIGQTSRGVLWTEGDTVIKNAFITDEDDIAPMGKHFLLQTEDQDLDVLPFGLSESSADNYTFSLDDGEGLTDLFDCDFPCP